MKKLFFLIILGLTSSLMAANPLILSDNKVYIKKGFDIKHIQELPEGNEWISIKPDKSIKIAKLPLPDKPKRSFLSLQKNEPQEYTFLFPFDTDKKVTTPALFIKEIDEDWEIYLNSTIIATKNHQHNNENITINKSKKNLIIPFCEDLIKPGTNFLAAKITGDPSNPLTGLYRMPVLIDKQADIAPMASERITLMLIAIYLAFGLYHIMLFLFNRREKYNLYFGFIGVLFFLYILSRTTAIYDIIDNSTLLLKIEVISLYMLIPAFLFFIDNIISKKPGIVAIIYSIFSLILILASIIPSEAFVFDVLKIWQATAIIPIIYYLFFVLGKAFIKSIRKNISLGINTLHSILRAFAFTVPGNILIGIIILVLCTAFDIYDALYLSLGLSISKYGFFSLIVGIAIMLANNFLYIHKQIGTLNLELEEKISNLDKATRLISISEEKYRILVEGTNEVIFLLDDKLRFKTVNKAASPELGVSPDKLKGVEFIEFLHSSADDKSVELQYVHEKIQELKDKGKPVLFKALYKSPLTLESNEIQVKLEKLTISGSEEILGKITRITEDSLQPFFISERMSYKIGNQLYTAEEASHRLTRNLNRYIDQKQTSLIRIALREMIINAIEHGNLEVTFEEKSQALEADTYFTLIAQRQNNPDFSSRRVYLECHITSEKAIYRITDNGKGFDHKKIETRFKQSHEDMLSHGRGIIMAKNIFDSVAWNNVGNQVLLVKNFSD